MAVLIFLLGILSFITGFLLGIIKRPVISPANKRRKLQFSDEDLLKEYENFLSYDGTEQT